MMRFDVKNRRGNILWAIVVGLCSSYIISLLMTFVFSIFINNEYIDIKFTSLSALFITFIAAIFGSLVGSGAISSKKLWVMLGTGCIYYTSILCATFILYDGPGEGALKQLIAICLGVICAILAVNRKGKGTKTRRTKTHSR